MNPPHVDGSTIEIDKTVRRISLFYISLRNHWPPNKWHMDRDLGQENIGGYPSEISPYIRCTWNNENDFSRSPLNKRLIMISF